MQSRSLSMRHLPVRFFPIDMLVTLPLRSRKSRQCTSSDTSIPASLLRICEPLNFWNLSSAAAIAAIVVTAAIKIPVPPNRLIIELSFALFASTCEQSPAIAGPLQHSLQGLARMLISQFDVLPGDPNFVTAVTGVLSGIETKLVLLHAPFADALVSHRIDRKRAISSEHLAPMRFIGQLHARELRVDLSTGELLKFLLGLHDRRDRDDHQCTRCHANFHRMPHCETTNWRSEKSKATPHTNSSGQHDPAKSGSRSSVTTSMMCPCCSDAVVCRGSRWTADGDPTRLRRRIDPLRQLFALAVLSSAARRPLASLMASSLAQKCMKNSRGCSLSMWLCTAVTSMPCSRRALITGLTSSPVSTKSPVMAALPPPVGWKLIAVASPIGPTGVICMPPSLIASRRGTPNA